MFIILLVNNKIRIFVYVFCFVFWIFLSNICILYVMGVSSFSERIIGFRIKYVSVIFVDDRLFNIFFYLFMFKWLK